MIDRTAVTKMQRPELEDRYLRLYDENLNLKQKINIQEDKMRKMATKLIRTVGKSK